MKNEETILNDIINKFFKEDFYKASSIIDNLRYIIEETKKRYNLENIKLTGALQKIVDMGFLAHIFSYPKNAKKFRDVMWGFKENKIDENKLYRTVKKSIKSIFSINMRNAYQCWVLLALLNIKNYKLLDKQYKKLKDLSLTSETNETIPPNFIMNVSGKFFSVFYEQPRPIGKTKKTNGKILILLVEQGYKTPKPDIMIYSGKIDNIYDPTEKPFPIRKNPFIIMECKESANWYKRVRKNKYEGKRKKEIDIVKSYKKIYHPEHFFLISLEKTPENICNELEKYGIKCINNTGFEKSNLIEIANLLEA